MIYFLNRHLPWLFVMFLITLQSALSDQGLDKHLFGFDDKIIHFFSFGIMGWLMTRGFSKTDNLFIRKHYYWFVLLIGIIFSFLDEFHQSLVPGRDADIIDLAADISGICLFMLLYIKRNKFINGS